MKSIFIFVFSILFFLTMQTTAFAQSSSVPSHAVCHVVYLAPDPALSGGKAKDAPPVDPGVKTSAWDDVVNLGKQIWQLLKDNQPEVAFQSKAASALPVGVKSDDELDGNWARLPRQVECRVRYKSLIGLGTDFKYRISYLYGATYKGHGRYLKDVNVEPVNIQASSFFKISADAGVPSVYTTRVSGVTVANARITVNWQVSSLVKKTVRSESYVVSGDGSFVDLGAYEASLRQ
jgi:hypothetical protein